jgi:hypothetical protein
VYNIETFTLEFIWSQYMPGSDCLLIVLVTTCNNGSDVYHNVSDTICIDDMNASS